MCTRPCGSVCVCVCARARTPSLWVCAVPEPTLSLWGKFPARRPSKKKFHPRRKTLVLTFPLSQQTGSRLRALQEA